MIPDDLLSALREKDQELWKHFQDGMIDGSGASIPFFDSDLKAAWLQHCLQNAIRARGWNFDLIMAKSMPCWTAIYMPDDSVFVGEADTEAEALLRAYLASLEAAE